MREGWEYKKLGEMATFINGYPFKPSDWKDSGRKIIRIQNLNNPDAVYNYYDGDIDTKYIVYKGDVLISWSGSLGVFEWSYGEAILNQHIFKVVFNRGEINKRFFEYVVSSRINEMKMKVHGITMQHITKRDFDVIPIPVPPLSEQQRIVSELDLLSSIIEKKKAQLKEYDQLTQSIFYDMFGDPVTNEKGWEVKKLGEVFKTSSGGTPSKSHNEYYENGTIPWLRSGEVAQGFIYETELFITEDGMNNSSAKMFPIDTVVVAMYGATVGQVGVLKKEMTTNQAICGIFPNSKYIPTYLFYFLKGMKPLYLKNAEGGAQPNISQNIIKNTLVPIVPLPLQQSFASKIEAIERQKALIQQSIAEVQMLFDSRMDHWFA